MELVRLNNVGRKFHKFINNGGLADEKNSLVNESPENGWFWALRNIYMSINQGEIIGIIGRNGSGKTTLLSLFSGRLPVSEGEVVCNSKISALLTLGAGFQDEFTGKENIFLNASLLGMKKQEIEANFMNIVEFSELGDFINAPLGSYSAGMKMRLGFSVAIHKDFDVLVTDEIIGVGDVSFQKKCFERMMDFKRENKSMVIATQDLAMVERFCDRAFLLEDGKVLSSGNPGLVIEQYQKLLNKKKILSEGSRLNMATKTKRWATDFNEWGKREGTKEVVLKGLQIINKWGRKTNRVKSGEKIAVVADLIINEKIDNFHFGIAVFREDGVYCYGPNTRFDGLAIGPLLKGKGYFKLEFRKFLLMPGSYYLSVAIWDKNETFAYDYHKCSYKIEVEGRRVSNQLLYLPNKWSKFNLSVFNNIKHHPAILGRLEDKWGKCLDSDSANFESVVFLNNYSCKDSVFVTGRDFKIKVDFKINKSLSRSLLLWVGIYRSDGVYCYGGIKKISSGVSKTEIIFFPKLNLLPGGYKVSAGIWDIKSNEFIAYSHGIHSFNMISEKEDHGTVYLEHRWNWRIPKER